MVSVEKMAKAWSGSLSLLAGITLIGLVSIPSGDPVTVQWSWGDWEPVRQMSKWIALLLIPIMTALIAWPAVARNDSEERADLLPMSAVVQLLVMGIALIAQSEIVFVATF